MMADMYWLGTVQYIGGNVIGWEYKKYLAVMIDLITDMNPYFESPYTIGQLLIPSSAWSYEDFTNPESIKDYQQAVKLSLKWIENFCNISKVEAIIQEPNLQKILSEEKYANPCKSYKIPYYLAYIYYFYLKENLSASKYYKVVAAQEDAPKGAKILAAIMQWKWWDREKSLFMFLSLAQNAKSQDEACLILSIELQKAYSNIREQDIPITWDFIRNIEQLSTNYLPKLSEENEAEVLDDTWCINFLAKAVREINLMYLEKADALYVIDNPASVSAITPEKLFSSGYINFIPTDYQQYPEKWYGIIYEYDDEIQRFDYKMWN